MNQYSAARKRERERDRERERERDPGRVTARGFVYLARSTRVLLRAVGDSKRGGGDWKGEGRLQCLPGPPSLDAG